MEREEAEGEAFLAAHSAFVFEFVDAEDERWGAVPLRAVRSALTRFVRARDSAATAAAAAAAATATARSGAESSSHSAVEWLCALHNLSVALLPLPRLSMALLTRALSLCAESGAAETFPAAVAALLYTLSGALLRSAKGRHAALCLGMLERVAGEANALVLYMWAHYHHLAGDKVRRDACLRRCADAGLAYATRWQRAIDNGDDESESAYCAFNQVQIDADEPMPRDLQAAALAAGPLDLPPERARDSDDDDGGGAGAAEAATLGGAPSRVVVWLRRLSLLFRYTFPYVLVLLVAGVVWRRSLRAPASAAAAAATT